MKNTIRTHRHCSASRPKLQRQTGKLPVQIVFHDPQGKPVAYIDISADQYARLLAIAQAQAITLDKLINQACWEMLNQITEEVSA